MSCPFPGMDPYLEDPVLWPGVHQDLMTYSKSALNAVLPDHYAANTGERLYVVESERGIHPDVGIFERRQGAPRAAGAGPAGGSASDPSWVLVLEPVEVREVFVEILALREGERVVTVIEVLSYSNKAPGSQGRELYLRKQKELLSSPVHLMEIDLLRGTQHIVAPPREELRSRGRWDYLVSLHRGGEGKRFEIWPFTVRQRFPRVRVPLAGEDPDIVLDLQAVFTRSYDEGGYARRIDYRRAPRVPLSTDDAVWADALLESRRS